jgi:hypothetical protein
MTTEETLAAEWQERLIALLRNRKRTSCDVLEFAQSIARAITAKRQRRNPRRAMAKKEDTMGRFSNCGHRADGVQCGYDCRNPSTFIWPYEAYIARTYGRDK